MNSKLEADGGEYGHISNKSSRWWSKETVSIVTGGNKGIGYEVVKKLGENGVTVILTARDMKRGSQALHSLITSNPLLRPLLHFYCLDVSDPSSIRAFVSWFSHRFGAFDILVNNAGVSFNEIGENSVENAEIVMKTNYFGAKLLTESLLPFFRLSSSRCRILNISSRLGSVDKVRNAGIREMMESRWVTEETIERVVRQFMEEVKSGRWRSGGWPEQWTDYAVSKLALNAYTKVLAERFRGRGVAANCCCPGFTKTAMTGGKGTHSAEDAAAMVAAIVLLPPHKLPTAHFFVWSSNPIHNTTILHSKL